MGFTLGYAVNENLNLKFSCKSTLNDDAPEDLRMDVFMVTLVFGWHPLIEGSKRLQGQEKKSDSFAAHMLVVTPRCRCSRSSGFVRSNARTPHLILKKVLQDRNVEFQTNPDLFSLDVPAVLPDLIRNSP